MLKLSETGKYLLFILFLVVALVYPAMGNAQAIPIPFTEEAENVLFSADEDGIWLLRDNKLLFLDGNNYEKSTEVTSFDNDKMSVALSSFDSDAYIAMREQDTLIFFIIDRSGVVMELFSMPYERGIRDMHVFQNRIAVLWGYSDMEYTSQEILISEYVDYPFTLFDFSGLPINIEGVERAANFTKKGENSLVFLILKSEGHFTVYSYDILTGLSEELGHTTKGSPFAPSGEENVLVQLTFQGLGSVDIMTGKETVLFPFSYHPFPLARMQISNGRVFWSIDQENVYAYCELSDLITSQRKTLTLVNIPDASQNRSYYLISKAIEKFKALYPEIEIRMSNVDETQLLVQLQARDDNLDILYIPSGSEVQYINMGILMDLKSHPAFVDSMDAWIDIGNIMSYNQVYYGVPLSLHALSINFNKNLFRDAGLSVPATPYSWTDLFELSKEFNPDVNGDGKPDLIFLHEVEKNVPTFYKQFTAHRENPSSINFLSGDFRQMAEGYKSLVERGLVYDWGNYKLRDKALISSSPVGIPNAWTSPIFDPVPMIGNDEAICVQVSAMGVNSNSTMSSVAADFIATYASQEVQSSEWALTLLKDIDVYPKEQELTNTAREQVQAYQQYIEKSQPQLLSSDFHSFTKNLFGQYLDSIITVEQLQNQLQQRFQMLMYE